MIPHSIIKTVDVGGLRTSYTEAGCVDRPSLVLVHDGGYGSNAFTCWNALLEPLSEYFHIVAPDLIGHGGTAKIVSFDTDPLTFRLTHVLGLVQTLGLDSPVLVGNSFGGALVLNAAARHLIQTGGVVTISGTGGLYLHAERFQALQSYSPSLDDARRLEQEMMPTISEGDVQSRFDLSMIPGHWETLSASRLRNPAAAEAPDWKPGYLAALKTIDIPVLIIAGSADRLLEADWQESLARNIPGAQVACVAGARHQPQRSHPHEVARLITEWHRRGSSEQDF